MLQREVEKDSLVVVYYTTAPIGTDMLVKESLILEVKDYIKYRMLLIDKFLNHKETQIVDIITNPTYSDIEKALMY